MVDTRDLKSLGREAVRVQVPRRVPSFTLIKPHKAEKALWGLIISKFTSLG